MEEGEAVLDWFYPRILADWWIFLFQRDAWEKVPMWGGRCEGSRLWGRRFQRQSEGEERDIVDRDNKQFVMDWALLP